MTPTPTRRTRRRLTTVVGSLIVAGLALSACGGKQTQEPSAGGTGGTAGAACEISAGDILHHEVKTALEIVKEVIVNGRDRRVIKCGKYRGFATKIFDRLFLLFFLDA